MSNFEEEVPDRGAAIRPCSQPQRIGLSSKVCRSYNCFRMDHPMIQNPQDMVAISSNWTSLRFLQSRSNLRNRALIESTLP